MAYNARQRANVWVQNLSAAKSKGLLVFKRWCKRVQFNLLVLVVVGFAVVVVVVVKQT